VGFARDAIHRPVCPIGAVMTQKWPSRSFNLKLPFRHFVPSNGPTPAVSTANPTDQENVVDHHEKSRTMIPEHIADFCPIVNTDED
jgi:hypothetical protein